MSTKTSAARRGLRELAEALVGREAVRRVRLAAELATTDDERERLDRAAGWQALKLAMATDRTRKPLPGLEE